MRRGIGWAGALVAVVTFGCDADEDRDGVRASVDCDDADPALGAWSEDRDCDGVGTAEDCDDGDDALLAWRADQDCDGVPGADDCNEADGGSTTRAEDGDCDGVLTAVDCDDTDASLGEIGVGRSDLHLGEVVCVPPGTFEMGCVTGRDDVEIPCVGRTVPAHMVTLTRALWVGAAEVTQAQYEAVMGANPSGFSGATLPVESVTWTDAVAFADLVSLAQGLTPCAGGDPYGCDGWRLPTEAEWEYVARAGTPFPFAGSADPDLVGWYGQSLSTGSTHPVCTKRRNAFGLCDLTGNVAEWVHDREVDYAAGAVTDPVEGTVGGWRQARGGSWYLARPYVVIAERTGVEDGGSSDGLGFRLVRSRP